MMYPIGKKGSKFNNLLINDKTERCSKFLYFVVRQILVVAGIISNNGHILIVQRPLNSDFQAGKWEFPGGKVEFGENPEVALQREIREELAMEISNLSLFCISSNMLTNDLHAVMLTYNCISENQNLQLLEGNDFRWIKVSELENYEFALLDLPVIEKLMM